MFRPVRIQLQTRLRSRLAVAAVLLAALSLLVLGCGKKKAGDKCSAGQTFCADKSTGLFCATDKKLATMSCGGPLGCVKNSPEDVDCDNSLAKEKDGCNQEDDVSCSTDKKAALQCKDGKFTLAETCKGPHACTLKDNKILCDNDISDLADPCHEEGDFACSSDKSVLLKCATGKFKTINTCRGPKGCAVHEHPEENKVGFACDDSVSQLNDPCDEENEESCDADKKALHKCKGGKFALEKNCKIGCTYNDATDHYTCK